MSGDVALVQHHVVESFMPRVCNTKRDDVEFFSFFAMDNNPFIIIQTSAVKRK